MRRRLRWISLTFLALNFVALIALVVLEKTKGSVLTTVREALTTRLVTDPRELAETPQELAAEGFQRDPAELIDAWRARIESQGAYRQMLSELAAEPSTVEKAKQIVLSFSRNGSDRTFPASSTLWNKLTEITEPPLGWCSDHTEVFLALASVAGLDASELVTGEHVTCEVYCPERKAWVWIDPQYALLAKGPDGAYLSGIELHEACVRQTPFEFEFFGLPAHEFSQRLPQDKRLFKPKVFGSHYAVVWGNNVFTVDKYASYLKFLPKSLQQFPLMMFGIQPQYSVLAETAPAYDRVFWWRLGTGLIIVVFAAGTLAYPAYSLATRLGRRQVAQAPASAPLDL